MRLVVLVALHVALELVPLGQDLVAFLTRERALFEYNKYFETFLDFNTIIF